MTRLKFKALELSMGKIAMPASPSVLITHAETMGAEGAVVDALHHHNA